MVSETEGVLTSSSSGTDDMTIELIGVLKIILKGCSLTVFHQQEENIRWRRTSVNLFNIFLHFLDEVKETLIIQYLQAIKLEGETKTLESLYCRLEKVKSAGKSKNGI